MKTTVDWLTFRAQNNPFFIHEALTPIWGTLGHLVTLETGMRKKDGWTNAASLVLAGDITLGRIDYGGESQRGWARVILSGEGCAHVQEWGSVVKLQNVLTQATIKRLDIALTTFKGEVSTKIIEDAYDAGLFTNGGRRPQMDYMGSRSNPRAGQTRYIGSRKSHKFLRCYEKGFEQLKDRPKAEKEQRTHWAGNRIEDIYRVELELKDADDKIIPWEAINGRDSILASAYPFCAQLLPDLPIWRMATIPDHKPKAALDTALDNCKIAYGAILRAGHMALNGDTEALLRRILADEPSHRLVEAGVLTVDHE